MTSDNAEQYRFSDSGELTEPEGEEDDGPTLRDDGEPMGRFQVKSGKNMFLITSLLYKSIRRSDQLRAAYAAWSLARSGYQKHCFKTMKTIAMEDIRSDSHAPLLVHRFEQWAGDYGPVEWGAVKSALALARAPSSREGDWARLYFDICAEERLKEDPDERFTFPEVPDEVKDMHSQEGKKLGRGMRHFMMSSSKVTDESDLGKRFKRRILQYEDYTDDPDEIEEAVADCDPGEHDERPEQNQSLSECG
jgi:replication-associated recombination protein RarA